MNVLHKNQARKCFLLIIDTGFYFSTTESSFKTVYLLTKCDKFTRYIFRDDSCPEYLAALLIQ